MNVKLTDVAKKAGVSPTTVSRVINRRGYISQETIKKVEDAMEYLHYQPNSLARSLQGKQTHLIGVIFPSIKQPFYAELIERIESFFFDCGYKCILCDSQNQSEKERHYLQMLMANKVDGIITGSHNLGIQEYNALTLPIVSFDRSLSPHIPIVSSDNFQGGMLAATALIDKGCRNLGIMTGASNTNSPTDQRLEGFKNKVIEITGQMPHIYRLSYNNNFSLKQYKIRQMLKEREVDGLFCTDDLTAIEVINETRCLSYAPDELEVVGYDGTELIQRYFPQLTTIVQPIEDEAKLLVDLLCQKIECPEQSIDNYQLPVQLKLGTNKS